VKGGYRSVTTMWAYATTRFCLAENSHHEVEQPPRVPAGEQDREPGEDDGEDYGCLLQQKYLPFETPEEAAEMVAEIMARPSLAEEYP
jgi:hypothetical protein